jgi:hypothetical protein
MDCKGVSDPTSGDSNFLSFGEVVRGDPFFCIFLNFFKFIGRWNSIPIILPLRVYLGFDVISRLVGDFGVGNDSGCKISCLVSHFVASYTNV